MTTSRATLHLLSGKIAAGKSTLTRQLAQAPGTIMLSEDHLLARLYPDEITTLADYVRCSARLREAIGPHIETLLRAGVSVVLDFQANTLTTRAWMRGLFTAAAADHRLHYPAVPDEVCKTRLRERNAAGHHEYQVSDAEFDLFTSYFVPPTAAEGFNIVMYT